MSQEALDFGLLYGVDDAYRKSMRALEDAFDVMSPLVAQGATKIDASDLGKMFTPGSGRHFRYRAAFAIGALSSYETRQRIILPFNNALGFGEPQPLKPMTAAEELARLKQRCVARFGAAGAELVEENRR